MNKKVSVKMEYKCGHKREKEELLHEGHDLQDKLDWFKNNVECHDCRDQKLSRRDIEDLMGIKRDTYKRNRGAIRRK